MTSSQFEEWIEKYCDTSQFNGKNDIATKMDFLERAIEALRIKNKAPKNSIGLKEFLEADISVKDNKLYLAKPQQVHLPFDDNDVTRPIQLQPKLLVFLLLNHKKNFIVYDAIENFINIIWHELNPLDFEKTRTGVTRCFTNTRFAANTLRDYGLLKDSQKEKYKIWTLSLYGFLVASIVIHNQRDWKMPAVKKDHQFDLYPSILDTVKEFQTYDNFVARLAGICEPNIKTNIFDTFKNVLKRAYAQLNTYSEIIQDESLSQKQRKVESQRLLKKLEEYPDMDKFYNEFSVCLNVEHFLKILTTQSSGTTP